MFVYKGHVYLIDDFNPGTVNVDRETEHVLPYCREDELCHHSEPSNPPKRKEKKYKGGKKNRYIAVLFSNIEECPDVETTSSETQAQA